MKRIQFLAAIALFSISFVACTTEEFTGTDAALATTAIDEAQASNLSDQVISLADDYIYNFENNGYQNTTGIQKAKAVSSSDTVIITVDKTGTTLFPKKICIDFGNGFTDKRANVLKGKLYITISNRMTTPGSTKKCEFYNFFINDNQLLGSKTITYNGLTDGKPNWSISVKDTVVRTDGSKVIWNSERVRIRMSNDTPLNFADDSYSITGTSNGMNAKGVSFTMTIVENKPLILVPGFKFFVSGAVLITTENRTALLDYGNGERDAKATVTINDVSKEINLRK